MLPTHSGVVAAKNAGYAMAAGELVATMDDDDVMHRDKLRV